MLDSEGVGQYIDAECVKLTKSVSSQSKSNDARQIAQECLQIMKEKGFANANATNENGNEKNNNTNNNNNSGKKKSKNKK